MKKSMQELKSEATDLGLTFKGNISAKDLSEMIENYYEDASNDGDLPVVLDEEETEQEVVQAAPAKSQPASKKVETPEERAARADHGMRTYARKMEAEARKTRVVTIIDNDQRVNNATTTCTANCSNEYFDLGTIILPLNERVEVRQGHLSALLGVRIPHHVRSPLDPAMSQTVMRPRYTIQYEDVGVN